MGLAPQMVTQIFRTIRQLKHNGTTILLIEQNAKSALTLSDRTYVLDAGKVALEGHSAELMHDPRIVSAYLGS